MESFFLGVIHRTADDEFCVVFPDFLGCTAVGRTFAEAERHAAESLHRHVEALIAVGAALPRPSDLETIRSRQESQGGAVIAVPVALR